MEALVLNGPEEIERRLDLPEPTLMQDTDAVVAVRLAGLCGSDLHPYLGREPVRPGTIPGHELVGTVLDAGNDVEGLVPGDLVLAPFTTSCGRCRPCRHALSARCTEGALLGWQPPEGVSGRGLEGAQAERIRIPLAGSTLVAVPDGVSEEAALLLGDNFSTGWFAAEGAEAGPGKTIAVIGCGAVGLAAVSAALQLGSARVVAIDPIEARRAIATGLGAVAVDPESAPELLAEREGGGGADGVIEAVGTPAAQSLALTLVATGGTIAAVGVHSAPTFSFSPGQVYDRNLTYRAGRAPVRSLLDRLLPEVVAGRVEVPIDAMISERGVSLSDGADAYRRFAARRDGVRKIVFAPGA